MEIFKLLESTISNSIKPGHPSTKDLRKDQLLDNYDEAIRTLENLIQAKQNEIAYRRDLVQMLEKSKDIYDNKLLQARQSYIVAKKQAPETLDWKSLFNNVGSTKKTESIATTPSSSSTNTTANTTTTPSATTSSTPVISASVGILGLQQSPAPSSQKSTFDLELNYPSESQESRSSLDRRLSEFLKTFPNLTQAGLGPPSNNNAVKPLPGYYTQQQQQPPPPPPPPGTMVAAAPPIMAMMRFPPPNLMPPNAVPPPPTQLTAMTAVGSQENHDTADMDLSDYEDSGATANAGGSLIPMVASAMQQGAGGKQHLRSEAHQSPYATGYSNSVPYAPRLNPLPFDPSIMDTRLRDSSSSGSRDKHGSDRSGRHSGSSSSGGIKHSSDKNKYSSSHSSSRSKRR